ncbi:dihydroorotate dehydrogenase, partial [Vibrio parahaemolyticus]
MRPYLKYVVPTLIPLLVWLMPLSAFPFDGITIVQQREIAIFLLAALCWVFEPIPNYATSLVIIVLELWLVS